MAREACREAFSKRILEEAKKDRDIVVICTDSRGSASLGSYPEELPEQFVELGIAEQNAVTMAAGMASVGKKAYVVGPASFYSMRAAEQVKVDVAYSHNNVKIIGISGGISYGALGATHHSLQDIALMRAIPGLIVEVPSDANQMRALVGKFLSIDDPVYVRIGRGPVPVIYNENCDVEIGKAITWFDGTDAAIIACGQMVWRALEAAKELEKEGIHVTVVDMHTIKPLDEETILSVAEKCGCVLTLEEHSIYGGLGGAVAEVLKTQTKASLMIVGIPDEDVPNGTDEEVFSYYGMDVPGIVLKVKELIEKKK